MQFTRARSATLTGAVALLTGALCTLLPADPASGARPKASAKPKVVHTAKGYITTYPDGEKVFSLTRIKRTANKHSAGFASSSYVPVVAGNGKTDGAVSAMTEAGTEVPSSVDMLEALGAPESVLAEFADFDDFDTNTSSGAAARRTPAATLTANTVWTGHDLIDRTCSGDSSLDGGHLSTWGCWNEYVVRKDGSDWQLLDKWHMSGTHSGGSNGITGLQQGESYGVNNQWIDWRPVKSWPTGSCYPKSITLGPSFFQLTADWTVCAEESGLNYIRGDVAPIMIRTKWNGNGDGPTNGARDTTGLAWVDSPSNASILRGWSWYAWWE